ncbi:MAG: hypothetical protein EBR09_01370 [Proteobacteria bacterium]|nr:hypothetical protein [Pseudomonadota bacterium]
MFLHSLNFKDSGVKSSAASRPRKSSPKKTKTAADSAEFENVSDSVSDTAPAESEGSATPAGAAFNQEENSNMSQSQNEQSWQNEVQGGGEQYAEGYAGNAADASGYYEEEGYYPEENTQGTSEYAGQNQIVLTLSYSLMNQVRQVARLEGVFPEDILIELIAEGVTRRAFEDAQRPAPSHLMTRTGYVAPDANGNVQQPHLSHHGMQGNQRGNHQGHNNRRFHQNNGNNNNRGNHFQNRNRQNNFKNKPRSGK